MIIAQREALIVAEAKAQNAEAEACHRALLIEKLKYTIAKLRHEKFGEVFRSMASEMLLRSQRKLHHAFQELVRR